MRNISSASKKCAPTKRRRNPDGIYAYLYSLKPYQECMELDKECCLNPPFFFAFPYLSFFFAFLFLLSFVRKYALRSRSNCTLHPNIIFCERILLLWTNHPTSPKRGNFKTTCDNDGLLLCQIMEGFI